MLFIIYQPGKKINCFLEICLLRGYADSVPRKKLPPEVMEFFRKQGSKGGKKAAASMTPAERTARAKNAAASMTPAERRARALKAVAAREAKRKPTPQQKDRQK